MLHNNSAGNNSTHQVAISLYSNLTKTHSVALNEKKHERLSAFFSVKDMLVIHVTSLSLQHITF